MNNKNNDNNGIILKSVNLTDLLDNNIYLKNFELNSLNNFNLFKYQFLRFKDKFVYGLDKSKNQYRVNFFLKNLNITKPT